MRARIPNTFSFMHYITNPLSRSLNALNYLLIDQSRGLQSVSYSAVIEEERFSFIPPCIHT